MCSAVVCWRVVKDGDRNCSNSSMPLVIVIAGGKYVLSQNSGVEVWICAVFRMSIRCARVWRKCSMRR